MVINLLLVLAVIVLAGVLYVKIKNRPKPAPVFNLKKFEKVYDSAISQFGEKNVEIITGTVKLTAEVLDVKYTADKEAEAAYNENIKDAISKDEEANLVLEEGEEEAADLERQAKEIRDQAAQAATTLKADAQYQRNRSKKLQKMLELM